MKWTDSSSYSRGERGNTLPSSWDLAACPFRVTVHRLHYMPNVWFLTVFDLKLEKLQLRSFDVADAQLEAVEAVRSRLTGLMSGFEKAAHLRSSSATKETP